MQEDIFPAAEKILSDIENILKKDSSVKTFEIIPAEDNENKSPVFHQEECLGLASWCVQPLYCYVHRRLFEHRRNKHRREDPSNVARWLLGALLLNPDVSTFWNMRRELVKSYKLDVTEELDFTRLVLYKKAKCFEAFAYRRWLLPYVLDAEGKNYDPVPTESPLCIEMDITSTCADRYATNYHAFSHRRYVMALKESRGYTYPNFDSEWKSTLAWCQSNVSDYSGFCYRQYLLEKCLLETDTNTKSNIFKCININEYRLRSQLVMDYVAGLIVTSIDNNSQSNQTNEDSTAEQGPTLQTLDLLHGKTRPTVTSDNIVTGNNSSNSNSSSSSKNIGHSSSNSIATTTCTTSSITTTTTTTTTSTSTTTTTSQLVPWQTCFQALSYWVEECRLNEDLIRMYDDHETLWYQRRYLAHILTRLIESYRMYSYYKSEIIVDPRHRIMPNEYGNVDEMTDDKSKIKALLVQAFLNRTRDIVELAMKRDTHEKLVVDKFLRYLDDIGLKL
ncbi:hypothetical protein HZH68_013543 [Vespula germanica]|uniref:Uncharacterized protein n=1 Tax=Vespula germanica TaxID=30212 RepID=A0A834JEV7_VESGE|nr:hypothetical protein HZH68_013543 [Vespula germanica]